MSTRATVHFRYGGKTEAIVYRHSDGYPELRCWGLSSGPCQWRSTSYA